VASIPWKALRPTQQWPGAGALERNALPGSAGPDNSRFLAGILLEIRAADGFPQACPTADRGQRSVPSWALASPLHRRSLVTEEHGHGGRRTVF
jgi:hypothetical protein